MELTDHRDQERMLTLPKVEWYELITDGCLQKVVVIPAELSEKFESVCRLRARELPDFKWYRLPEAEEGYNEIDVAVLLLLTEACVRPWDECLSSRIGECGHDMLATVTACDA